MTADRTRKSASTQKSTAQKSTAQKSTAQKSTAKKSPAKKTAAQKTAAQKTAKKAPPKKAAAKKAAPKKAAAKASAPRAESRPRASAADVADRALDQLARLTGKPVEGVTAVERTDDGWRVTVEILEVRRVPETTDVLAQYEVDTDEKGELDGYRRVSRYTRGSVREE